MADLTHKQKLFALAYLGEANGNATEAARLAGYRGNDVTLASVGLENLRKPQISALIEARLSEAAMSGLDILRRLTGIARREGDDVTVKDQLRALELLGKHHRLFTDRIEQNNSGRLEVVVRYEKRDGTTRRD